MGAKKAPATAPTVHGEDPRGGVLPVREHHVGQVQPHAQRDIGDRGQGSGTSRRPAVVTQAAGEARRGQQCHPRRSEHQPRPVGPGRGARHLGGDAPGPSRGEPGASWRLPLLRGGAHAGLEGAFLELTAGTEGIR
jgi:hypothetical protein